LASEKVSEMLNDGAAADMSKPQAADAPVEPKRLEQLGEFSPVSQKQPRRLSPRAFIPD